MDELRQAVQKAAKHAADVVSDARFPAGAIFESRPPELMSEIARKDLGGAGPDDVGMTQFARRFTRGRGARVFARATRQGHAASPGRRPDGVAGQRT